MNGIHFYSDSINTNSHTAQYSKSTVLHSTVEEAVKKNHRWRWTIVRHLRDSILNTLRCIVHFAARNINAALYYTRYSNAMVISVFFCDNITIKTGNSPRIPQCQNNATVAHGKIQIKLRKNSIHHKTSIKYHWRLKNTQHTHTHNVSDTAG